MSYVGEVALELEPTGTPMTCLHGLGKDSPNCWDRHHTWVGEIAESIAVRTGLSPKLVKLAKLAGENHDLWKYHDPELYERAGPLSPEEEERQQLHPVFSAMMVESALQGYLSEGDLILVADAIAGHHLRPEGGYPVGLVLTPLGEIVGLADVLDVLLHGEERPYLLGTPKRSLNQVLIGLEKGGFSTKLLTAGCAFAVEYFGCHN